MNFGSALEQVHRRAPLVDCITNFVTVNDCANILLAVGGSPTMASDIREVQETAAAASALLCNLGAIDKVESMILGGQAANRAGKPVVFDPVGAGNTSLRRAESARLLDAVQFAVIRGNASEIRALAQRRAAGSGVDVSDADQILSLIHIWMQARNLQTKYPWVTLESMYPTVGMSSQEYPRFMARLCRVPFTPEFEKELMQADENEPIHFPDILRPEARPMLEQLRAMGLQLALASSSPMSNIRQVLGECGLMEFFPVIVSGEQFEASKPEMCIRDSTGAKRFPA